MEKFQGSKLLIFGAGEHAKVVLDVLTSQHREVVGFIDDQKESETHVHGLPILGKVGDLLAIEKTCGIRQGIVAIGDNSMRSRVVERIIELIPDFRFVSAIHAYSHLAPDVILGEGTVVMAGVVVNPGTMIGRHCILNTHVSVDHDNRLGDYCSLAPGVVTGGTVQVGERSAIGLGSCISHGCLIGSDSVIGVGSVVIGNVSEQVVAFGVPAKIVRGRVPGERYL